MNLFIRASTDTDVAAFAAIYARSVLQETASWEYTAPSTQEFAERRQHVLAKGYPYLAADVDGDVVGYSYASAYRTRAGYRFVVEDSVYVRDDMKGRGIGKALLLALIAACTANGYRQMIAVIGDSGNVGSVKLHAACGFATVAVFKGIGYKFDRWLDSVQMQRTLGDGSTSPPA